MEKPVIQKYPSKEKPVNQYNYASIINPRTIHVLETLEMFSNDGVVTLVYGIIIQLKITRWFKIFRSPISMKRKMQINKMIMRNDILKLLLPEYWIIFNRPFFIRYLWNDVRKTRLYEERGKANVTICRNFFIDKSFFGMIISFLFSFFSYV